jgi:hypothetical protein
MNLEPVNTDAVVHQPSRKITWIAGWAATALLVASAAAAQGGASPSDSLAERLQRAEAAIATLQTQLAEQAQSGVQTRSRARLEVAGRVMVNAFHNSNRVNNVDNPQFVQNTALAGAFTRGAGMAIRQSQLGLVVTIPEALGGSFTGDLDVDFYGGQLPSSGGRTFPLMRLRTARGVVRWTNAHLMVGQESPLISALNPVTVAAIGTPAFATAGNLWLWLPQFRAGVDAGSRIRFGVQGAVLAPTSGDAALPFDTDNDFAERSQRPFLQARAHARWREGETALEAGCGIHHGWLQPGPTRRSSKAIACDARLPLTEMLEIRGEAFKGEALRGLGGGGIGQNFIPDTTRGLRSTGGWAQLNVRLIESVRVGAGCGGDHPEAMALRRRNDACAGYALFRPGPLFVGAEFRRLRTGYANNRFTNDHVTLAAGFEF